jgi:hypothetical protein
VEAESLHERLVAELSGCITQYFEVAGTGQMFRASVEDMAKAFPAAQISPAFLLTGISFSVASFSILAAACS